MEANEDEEKIMTFMAMTECENRNTAIRLLEKSDWDEVSAACTFFAEKSQHPTQPYVRPPDAVHGEKLIDYYDFHDKNFYGQDPTVLPSIEMPKFFGGISKMFSNFKDFVVGCTGGRYFIKELEDKYSKIDFSVIPFE
jgi:hypothetical protein